MSLSFAIAFVQCAIAFLPPPKNSMNNSSPITDNLKKFFGENFENATLGQKLILVEAISILLRQSADSFGDAVDAAIADNETVGFPDRIMLYDHTFSTPNEGLLLIGELHSAIIEDYAVLAAKKTD